MAPSFAKIMPIILLGFSALTCARAQGKNLDVPESARWSRLAASWTDAAGNVVVPAGETVWLDTDVQAATLTIHGKVHCLNQNLHISARWIMVHGGELGCGSEAEAFQKQLTIELLPPLDANEDVMGMGTRFLAAMDGGRIELHGEERTSWLMLDRSAVAGDQTLTLEKTVNWRVGDRIFVSSTAQDMNQLEMRRITSIDGSDIGLDQPLKHAHFGEQQTFSNDAQTWVVDTRAEVGLMSRNIQIQSTDVDASGLGGHVMVMVGASARMSGVEMVNLGQRGRLGRYAFHWHLVGDGSGQYLRNSSIYKSNNRCVTVHGTHNTQVDDNVCIDHIGHGFFLEDGVETGNRFDHNLGALTRKPKNEDALVPSDNQGGLASRGPATFWISNPNNTFTRNAVAGSEVSAFWYDTKTKVTGLSANLPINQGINPSLSNFGIFKDNRVHSTAMAFSSCSEGAGPNGYNPPSSSVYENLTIFHGGTGAVWPCGRNQTFKNLQITDTGGVYHFSAFVAPTRFLVDQSLFVANSRLAGDKPQARGAFGIYDFGVVIKRSHFVNYSGTSPVFTAMGGATRVTNTRMEESTFGNSTNLMLRYTPIDRMVAENWGSVVHDVDGSMGFGPDTVLVPDHPMMVDASCSALYGEGRLCKHRMGLIRILFGHDNLPEMVQTRSDGIRIPVMEMGPRPWYQSVVAVNQNLYTYGYEFTPELLAGKNSFDMDLNFLKNGDTVVTEFKALPTGARVKGMDWSAASSVQALKDGPGNQYRYEGHSLFVKIKAAGAEWSASRNLTIQW